MKADTVVEEHLRNASYVMDRYLVGQKMAKSMNGERRNKWTSLICK